MLRAAWQVPPFHIRGADALLTYHAIMVLWSFGMMLQDEARRTGISTPIGRQSKGGTLLREATFDPNMESNIFLDDAKSPKLDAFLYNGKGRPSLKFQDGKCCELRNIASVMALGCKVLESNCPGETRDRMPQMLKSLCNLMDELGALK